MERCGPTGIEGAARIRELKAQLPEGMKDCTIWFKECEHGHGRLVATKWVDHGCHWCRIRELEALLGECERALDVIIEDQTTGGGDDTYPIAKTLLAKLRTQERG